MYISKHLYVAFSGIFMLVNSSSDHVKQSSRPIEHSIVGSKELTTSDVRSDDKIIAITEIIKNKDVLGFLDKNEVLSRAVQIQNETGLSAATIIAQKGLESRWGKSKFCARTKNLSNVKCTKRDCKKSNIKGLTKRGQTGSETKHCIQLYDDGPNDRYVKLDYMWEGWSKYKKTINLPRYKKARIAKTIEEEPDALRRGGFATDKKYGEKILSSMRTNNLIELQKYIDAGYTITTQTGKYILLDQRG